METQSTKRQYPKPMSPASIKAGSWDRPYFAEVVMSSLGGGERSSQEGALNCKRIFQPKTIWTPNCSIHRTLPFSGCKWIPISINQQCENLEEKGDWVAGTADLIRIADSFFCYLYFRAFLLLVQLWVSVIPQVRQLLQTPFIHVFLFSAYITQYSITHNQYVLILLP